MKRELIYRYCGKQRFIEYIQHLHEKDGVETLLLLVLVFVVKLHLRGTL